MNKELVRRWYTDPITKAFFSKLQEKRLDLTESIVKGKDLFNPTALAQYAKLVGKVRMIDDISEDSFLDDLKFDEE